SALERARENSTSGVIQPMCLAGEGRGITHHCYQGQVSETYRLPDRASQDTFGSNTLDSSSTLQGAPSFPAQLGPSPRENTPHSSQGYSPKNSSFSTIP